MRERVFLYLTSGLVETFVLAGEFKGMILYHP